MAIQYDICDEIPKEFNELKFGKNDNRYMIIELKKAENGKEKFVISRIGQKNESWADFLSNMPENQVRFGIYDIHFTNADNMNITKLLFIHWLPDLSPIKAKVPYATGKENLKKTFGTLKEFTISSKNDLSEADLIKELSK